MRTPLMQAMFNPLYQSILTLILSLLVPFDYVLTPIILSKNISHYIAKFP